MSTQNPAEISGALFLTIKTWGYKCCPSVGGKAVAETLEVGVKQTSQLAITKRHERTLGGYY